MVNLVPFRKLTNMSAPKIKQLESLLEKQLGKNTKIIHVEETDFLGKGENYGSTLFRVDVTTRDEESGKEEVLHAVAKMLPESEDMKHMFNVQMTVGKEMSFYNEIVPRMKEFIRESGADIDSNLFPELYGGRLNLNGSDKVDDDSVIVFENLIAASYKNVDRHVGFDYETTKLIIRDIAVFHAVPLAFRLHRPEEFANEIEKFCKISLPQSPPDGKHRGPPGGPPDGPDGRQPGGPPDGPFGPDGPHIPILKIITENEKCAAIGERLKEKFKHLSPPFMENVPDSPWNTIAHNDLWVNNIMTKFENDKPVSNKFVDFQIYSIGSCLKDLFFFIWSSAQQSVLEEAYDELVKYYHEVFIDVLTKLKCDTKPYDFDLFIKELNDIAKEEVPHALFFLSVVFGKKGGVPTDGLPKFDQLLEDASLTCKEKVWFMVLEFERRKFFK